MKIDQVILKGFRNYKEATINSNNNTLIIGENDIGKTKMARRHEQWVVGDLDGDKNLHYVAITRAEKFCYLVSMSVRVNSQFQERTAEKSEFLCIERLNKHIVDLGVM